VLLKINSHNSIFFNQDAFNLGLDALWTELNRFLTLILVVYSFSGGEEAGYHKEGIGDK
jgi:hypothetical protein